MVGLQAIFVFAVAIPGCAPKRPWDAYENADRAAPRGASRKVVAKVNGESITRSDLSRRREALPLALEYQFKRRDNQKKFLRTLADFELMADAAEKQGIGSEFDTYIDVKSAVADRYLERRLSGQKTSILSDEVSPDKSPLEASRARVEGALRRSVRAQQKTGLVARLKKRAEVDIRVDDKNKRK